MKYFFSIFLFIIAMDFQMIANSTNDEVTDEIELILNKEDDKPNFNRAPMRINVKAFYDSNSRKIKVFYNGEAEGEVFLYLNEDIIGYDSQINTSLTLPSTPGLYKIEIIGETWMAQGYLQL